MILRATVVVKLQFSFYSTEWALSVDDQCDFNRLIDLSKWPNSIVVIWRRCMCQIFESNTVAANSDIDSFKFNYNTNNNTVKTHTQTNNWQFSKKKSNSRLPLCDLNILTNYKCYYIKSFARAEKKIWMRKIGLWNTKNSFIRTIRRCFWDCKSKLILLQPGKEKNQWVNTSILWIKSK